MELNDFQFYTDSAEFPKRVGIRENQCLDCFALYLNPCYSDYGFRTLFAEAGQSYGASEGRPDEQVNWLRNRGLLKSGTEVLDVGCYDGRFLRRLSTDVKRTGVDIDEPAIERGRREFGMQGIEFVFGDFETFQYPGVPGTVTMTMVLEHLPRPVSVMRKLFSISHPSTRLVVEVPILENGITNDINGFFSVHHMTHFSRRSLQNCLAQGGWRIVEWCEPADYNGCRVIAQPCGKTCAIKGNVQDIISLQQYLSGWYQALANVERKLAAIQNVTRCLIWGGGAHTEFLYHTTSFFQRNPECDYAIVDNDPIKQGKSWRGIAIHSPLLLKEIDWAEVCLLVSSYGSQEAVVHAAMEMGVPLERIVRLYDEFRIH